MKTATKVILSILILLAVFLIVEIVRSPDKNSVQIYYFNVGQGDAELIQKGDYQILIDGGPDDTILSELGKAMPLTDRYIEVLILTHPHADHLTGINQVLERYQIGQIYLSGGTTTSNTYLEFLNTVKAKSISTKIPSIDETIKPFEDSKLTFFWPSDKYLDRSVENLNNSSEVVKRQINYSASILKISHHGSSNGTDQTALEKIKPEYAVIEVGANNKFGHPHAATLDLLSKAGIKTYRTDRDGTVKFQLRQNEIEIK